MAYLVRAMSAGGKWQYIGRRVTRQAAENLAADTVRATGRPVALVNEREPNNTLHLYLPSDVAPEVL